MKRRILLFAALGLLGAVSSGCERSTVVAGQTQDAGTVLDAGTPDVGQPDAGCAVPCGANCCPAAQVCLDAEAGRCGEPCGETTLSFCHRLNAACGALTGTDLCGQERTVDCGGCASSEECDLQTHQCRCVPETDREFCDAAGRQCGGAVGNDRCGGHREVLDCGTCAAHENCSAQGVCEKCEGETDAQLCLAQSRECGPLEVTDRCGVARSIAECGPCAIPMTCGLDEGRCVAPPPPANDTCQTAKTLNFVNDVAQETGDTYFANDDATQRCAPANTGGDVVYTFTTTDIKDVKIVVTPTPAGTTPPTLQPIVAVWTSCRRPGYIANSCTRAPAIGDPAAVYLQNLSPGTYFLFVDSFDNTKGFFALSVELLAPPPPPANDSCATVQALTLVNGSATVTGTTMGASGDYMASCQSVWDSSGPDVVYSFVLGQPSSVQAKVVRDRWASFYSPAVYLLAENCPGSPEDEKTCGPNDQGTAVASIGLLPAGTYYVVVDGQDGTAGPFTLSISTGAPLHGDTCADANELYLDPLYPVAMVNGDNSRANDSSFGSCSMDAGADLVWGFDLDRRRNLDISVTAAAGSAMVPVVYLRQGGCEDAVGELGCARGAAGSGGTGGTPAAATLSLANLDPGRYYVFVDSASAAASGPFTLSLTASSAATPPSNDDCSAPELLNFNTATGKASVSGSTRGANDQYTGGCTAMTGPDVVYQMDVRSAQAVRVRVTPSATTSPAFMPSLHVRKDRCGLAAAEVGCDDMLLSGKAPELYWPNLAGGTYYLFVDGTNPVVGDFTLEAEMLPAVLHDSCAGTPKEITLDTATGEAHLTDDLSLGLQDSDGSCNAPSGRDLVYTFTLLTAQRLEVQAQPATPGAGFAPALYLRRYCDDPLSEASCVVPGPGGQASMTIDQLPAGQWFLWADAGFVGGGAITLDLKISSPTGPANDNCATAEALQVDTTTGVATVIADTTTAFDDYRGTCGATKHGGGDLVYKLTLSDSSAVIARVTADPGSSFQPAVYIRSSCESAAPEDEHGCATGPDWYLGGSATASAPSLPAGDYYVIVDGVSGPWQPAGGPVTLEVRVASPLTNDNCRAPNQATALQFDPVTGIAVVTADTGTATDDGDPNCTNGTGKDLVYKFTLRGDASFNATLAPDASSALQPVLSLRTACEARASEFLCRNNWAPIPPLNLSYSRLPGGTYYLWVDGASGTEGAFTLTVTLGASPNPPANDTCAGATQLFFDTATGVATTFGSTAGAADDLRGLCAPPWTPTSGGDLVYWFQLDQSSHVSAVVTGDFMNSPDFRPAVYIRTSCASTAGSSEVACGIDEGTFATATAADLPAGIYYVVVDGMSYGIDGSFDLELTRTAAVSNDSCAGPVELDFSQGAGSSVTVTGDTREVVDSGDATCAFATGPDLVYRFVTGEVRNLSVVVTPDTTNGQLQPVVYLRSDCELIGTEIACKAMSPWDFEAKLDARALPAGTWYLWVDSASPMTVGAFSMTVTLSDPGLPPANDECAGVIDVPISTATNTGSVTGSTATARDGFAGSCGGVGGGSQAMTGGDVVYSFTLTTAAADVTAKVTGIPAGNPDDLRPAVYIRSSCASAARADELACAAMGPYDFDPTVTTPRVALGRGTYYVVVDGMNATYGDFTLEITATPIVAGDSCANPGAIVLTNGRGSASGNLTPAADHGEGSCVNGAGKDLVYSFTTGATKNVTLEMTATGGASGFRPYLHVHGTCESQQTTEVGCATTPRGGTGARLFLPLLPAGTWYVFADAVSATASGTFDLTVQADDPPVIANDRCLGATALQFDASGIALVPVVDTTSAAKDYSGTCIDSSAASDVVFKMTVSGATAKSVTATVERDASTPGWEPVVYVRKVCDSGDAQQELTCARAQLGTARATINNLPPGTYYVVVDGAGASWGKGSLKVALGAAVTTAPANESCASAQTITLPASGTGTVSVSGSTVGAVDETWGSCAALAAAPDVVYRVVTTAEQSIEARVTPTALSGFRPAVYIRSSCGSLDPTEEMACAAAPKRGVAATATVRRAAAGVYFIWVDGGAVNDSGSFTLDVTVDAPVGPVNDNCLHPEPLSLGVPVLGDTTGAANDWECLPDGSCMGSGPDLVYSYTPAMSGPFVVTMTPRMFDAVLWYSVGTCGAMNGAVSNIGGPEGFTINGTAGTTYYIVADGSLGAGPFMLLVR